VKAPVASAPGPREARPQCTARPTRVRTTLLPAGMPTSVTGSSRGAAGGHGVGDTPSPRGLCVAGPALLSAGISAKAANRLFWVAGACCRGRAWPSSHSTRRHPRVARTVVATRCQLAFRMVWNAFGTPPNLTRVAARAAPARAFPSHCMRPMASAATAAWPPSPASPTPGWRLTRDRRTRTSAPPLTTTCLLVAPNSTAYRPIGGLRRAAGRRAPRCGARAGPGVCGGACAAGAGGAGGVSVVAAGRT
jgi:hypothetical protein